MTRKEILEKTIDFDDAIDWIVKLEKEKCELLGLIQAKDKLIEKMKRCKNCEFSIPKYGDLNTQFVVCVIL